MLFFFVDAKGQSGGLTMFWKTPFNCCLLNYYFNFINMKIHLVKIVSKLIVYYGFQKRDKRKGSWNLLWSLAHSSIGAWCIFGDFNDLFPMTISLALMTTLIGSSMAFMMQFLIVTFVIFLLKVPINTLGLIGRANQIASKNNMIEF